MRHQSFQQVRRTSAALCFPEFAIGKHMGSVGGVSDVLRKSDRSSAPPFDRGSLRDTGGPNARAAPDAVFARSGICRFPRQRGRPIGLRRPRQTAFGRAMLRATEGESGGGVNGPSRSQASLTRGSNGAASAGRAQPAALGERPGADRDTLTRGTGGGLPLAHNFLDPARKPCAFLEFAELSEFESSKPEKPPRTADLKAVRGLRKLGVHRPYPAPQTTDKLSDVELEAAERTAITQACLSG